jgi:hypothetical protein
MASGVGRVEYLLDEFGLTELRAGKAFKPPLGRVLRSKQPQPAQVQVASQKRFAEALDTAIRQPKRANVHFVSTWKHFFVPPHKPAIPRTAQTLQAFLRQQREEQDAQEQHESAEKQKQPEQPAAQCLQLDPTGSGCTVPAPRTGEFRRGSLTPSSPSASTEALTSPAEPLPGPYEPSRPVRPVLSNEFSASDPATLDSLESDSTYPVALSPWPSVPSPPLFSPFNEICEQLIAETYAWDAESV